MMRLRYGEDEENIFAFRVIIQNMNRIAQNRDGPFRSKTMGKKGASMNEFNDIVTTTSFVTWELEMHFMTIPYMACHGILNTERT